MKTETDNETREVRRIPLGRIVSSPYQVRAENDDDIASLAEDLERNGLVQPVTVRVRKGYFVGVKDAFELVAGHRRCAAARKLGWKEIDAIVVEADDAQAEAMLVSENFARRDLTPLEMADTAAGLVKRHGAAEAAKICGKSERWAQRMAFIAGRLSDDWRTVARAWELSQASLEAVARNGRDSQREILAGVMKTAKAANVAALAAMSGTASVEALDDGGNPRDLEFGEYPSDACWLKYAPWIDCGLPDCDGCQNRTDCMPRLDDEKLRFDMVRCTDTACFKRKMKEWMSGRGKEEWERKLEQEVIPLPKNIEYYNGVEKRDRSRTVPVFMPSTCYVAGFVRWFEPDVIHPPKKQPKEKVWPTDTEVRETAFCETVRDWLRECDDTHALLSIVIALGLNCNIGDKDVWGSAERLAAVKSLDLAGIVASLQDEVMRNTKYFLSLDKGRTGHTKNEVDLARAVADIICNGDRNALDGLRLEADHLASKRIEAIAEAKKARAKKARAKK